VGKWTRVFVVVLVVGVVAVAGVMGLAYYRRNVYVPPGFSIVRRGQTAGAIAETAGVIVEGTVSGGVRAPTVRVNGQVRGGIEATGLVVIGPTARVEGTVRGDVVRATGPAAIYGDVFAREVQLGGTGALPGGPVMRPGPAPEAATVPFEVRVTAPGAMPSIYGDVTADFGMIHAGIAGDVHLKRGVITAGSRVKGKIDKTGYVIREDSGRVPARPGQALPPRRWVPRDAPERPGIVPRLPFGPGSPARPASPPAPPPAPGSPQPPGIWGGRIPFVPGPGLRLFAQHLRARGLLAVFALCAIMWLPATLGAIALGIVVQALAPRQLGAIWERLNGAPLRALGTGILAKVVTVLLGVLLAVSIIGIPLALILAVGTVLAGMVGYSAVGWGIGHRLLEARKYHSAIELAVGVALLSTLLLVPIIGWAALGALTAMAYGAIVGLYGPALVFRRSR